MKFEWARKELLWVDEDHAGHCSLCGGYGWIDKIKHESDCPLADPEVTIVTMFGAKSKKDAAIIKQQIGQLHLIVAMPGGHLVGGFFDRRLRDAAVPALTAKGYTFKAVDR